MLELIREAGASGEFGVGVLGEEVGTAELFANFAPFMAVFGGFGGAEDGATWAFVCGTDGGGTGF